MSTNYNLIDRQRAHIASGIKLTTPQIAKFAAIRAAMHCCIDHQARINSLYGNPRVEALYAASDALVAEIIQLHRQQSAEITALRETHGLTDVEIRIDENFEVKEN